MRKRWKVRKKKKKRVGERGKKKISRNRSKLWRLKNVSFLLSLSHNLLLFSSTFNTKEYTKLTGTEIAMNLVKIIFQTERERERERDGKKNKLTLNSKLLHHGTDVYFLPSPSLSPSLLHNRKVFHLNFQTKINKNFSCRPFFFPLIQQEKIRFFSSLYFSIKIKQPSQNFFICKKKYRTYSNTRFDFKPPFLKFFLPSFFISFSHFLPLFLFWQNPNNKIRTHTGFSMWQLSFFKKECAREGERGNGKTVHKTTKLSRSHRFFAFLLQRHFWTFSTEKKRRCSMRIPERFRGERERERKKKGKKRKGCVHCHVIVWVFLFVKFFFILLNF